MEYRDRVKAAAAALATGEDAQWQLAQLTYESTIGHGERPSADKVTMAQWCADVTADSPLLRFGTSPGGHYRRAWERFGETVDRPSFSDAYWEVRNGGNKQAEFESLHVRNAVNGSATVRRDTLRQLAADPEVRDEIVAAVRTDPELADAIVRDDTADRALDQAHGRTPRARQYEAEAERERKAAAARAAEQGPRELSPMEALHACWAVDEFMERAQEAPRTEQTVTVLNLFAQAIRRDATYAEALASGDHLPPTDAEFTAGLEALLGDPA